MFGTILCVAALTLGVDYGYEPNADDGLEYIVQINSKSLEGFLSGRPIRSDLPKDLRGLRTIRIQFADEKLPRVALGPKKSVLLDPPPVADAQKATPSPSDKNPPAIQPKELAGDLQGKPLVADNATYIDPLESGDASKSNDKKSVNGNAGQTDPQKPWSLLYGVVLMAAGLAAAFVYLAWIHIGMRSRYRMLLAEHLAMTQPT